MSFSKGFDIELKEHVAESILTNPSLKEPIKTIFFSLFKDLKSLSLYKKES